MAEGPVFQRGMKRLLKRMLGMDRYRLLEHGLSSFERILPHADVGAWRREPASTSEVVWQDRQRRALVLRVAVPELGSGIEATLVRRPAPAGVGRVARTIDLGERNMVERIVEVLAADLDVADDRVSSELKRSFDERVVARYIQTRFQLRFDLRPLLDALHLLAEQTYETRSMTFGVLIGKPGSAQGAQEPVLAFPDDYLSSKKYRALSDGYRVAYRLSGEGVVTGLGDLTAQASASGEKLYFPEWARHIALASRQEALAIALTRHGDIVLFANGNLHLSYRSGQWRYWNHAHVVDLVSNTARVQKITPRAMKRLVSRLYRLALDVSFRHTGGLILVLRSRQNVRRVVRAGDAMGDRLRSEVDQAFDESLLSRKVTALPLSVLSELASLDGAIVVASNGDLLAYGAVLQPHKTGRVSKAEGARTKAGIGASQYGVSMKVSSDGGITVFKRGEVILSI